MIARARGLGVGGALLASLVAGAASGQSLRIVDPGQGNVVLEVEDRRGRELSGITRAAGDEYYAVSDKDGMLFPIRIRVDLDTGFLSETQVGAPTALERSTDLEGVAYNPAVPSLFVVDEIGPAIREYRLGERKPLRRLELPRIFRRVRADRSLESLSFEADSGALWTANEEALQSDGGRAGLERGTLVRLQRFDRDGAAAGQWAYLTEPIPGQALHGLARNGVSELLALPSGELLVLERSLGDRGLGARVFAVDFRGASDVSDVEALARARFTATRKVLLWEMQGLTGIFEGMALGPVLADGSRSLILVSDGGGIFAPTLYALRLARE